MKTRRRIVLFILLTVTASLTYVCVSHATKNAGALWSGFDSQDGVDSGLSSGYVVVDAVDMRNGGSDGIGPFQANAPSFNDPDIVLYEEGDEAERNAPGDEVNVVWKEVRVTAGDTLSKIAENHGLTIKEIMQANELTDEHNLREGQILYVPNSSEYVLETLAYVRKLKNEEISRKKQAKAVKITNYVVKDGDTLWSIANAFDLDINSLFGCNKLSDSNILKVGTTIRVPNQDGIMLVVKSGQTLDGLAKEYGVFMEAILSANEMSPGDVLVAGREIFLPGAKVSAFVESNGARVAVARSSVSASQGFGWPVVGKISSSFGWRKDPVRGGRDFHTGLDIRAPRGRQIVASQGGKVVHSGWMGGYGKTIVISHSGGVTTLYAHCSSLLVKAGANVKRGQKIALIGSTGRSTGNHVHFEVRKSGTPMNPLKYIK
jgi:murein DD-endopeptidase MepM/ murein hydrolase activator NlpD